MYQIHWRQKEKETNDRLGIRAEKLVWPPNLDNIFLSLFVINK